MAASSPSLRLGSQKVPGIAYHALDGDPMLASSRVCALQCSVSLFLFPPLGDRGDPTLLAPANPPALGSLWPVRVFLSLPAKTARAVRRSCKQGLSLVRSTPDMMGPGIGGLFI